MQRPKFSAARLLNQPENGSSNLPSGCPGPGNSRRIFPFSPGAQASGVGGRLALSTVGQEENPMGYERNEGRYGRERDYGGRPTGSERSESRPYRGEWRERERFERAGRDYDDD